MKVKVFKLSAAESCLLTTVVEMPSIPRVLHTTNTIATIIAANEVPEDKRRRACWLGK
jgi:hypothetical protein